MSYPQNRDPTNEEEYSEEEEEDDEEEEEDWVEEEDDDEDGGEDDDEDGGEDDDEDGDSWIDGCVEGDWDPNGEYVVSNSSFTITAIIHDNAYTINEVVNNV